LDKGLQDFVLQIADGHTQLKDLLGQHQKAIVQIIKDEGTKNREHVDSELREIATQLASSGPPEWQRRERFLGSCKYDNMTSRLDQVETAHRDTCRWIMHCKYYEVADSSTDDETSSEIVTSNEEMSGESEAETSDQETSDEASAPSSRESCSVYEYEYIPWDCFHCWVWNPWNSADSVYWIQGKPGSGKSTCSKAIISYGGILSLAPRSIVLSHFIWALGSDLQKSMRGVLLALVYQYLAGLKSNQRQSIVDNALSLHSDKVCHNDWLTEELSVFLSSCLSLEQMKVFVVLDGLDEISVNDQQKVLDLVDQLSTIDNVKVCVTSRPEPIFKSNLEVHPGLRMSDLTDIDMRKYATDKLLASLNCSLDGNRYRYEWRELAKDVARKAQGVFLWTVLAVGSLQRGMRDGDTLEELKSRLEKMPSDLHSLYHDMWLRLNSDDRILYRSEAAFYFALMRDRDRCHIFDMMVACNPSIARGILQDRYTISASDVKPSWELLKRRLVARTGGMIEVDDECWYVQLVHRSVNEFLENTLEGQQIMAYDHSTPGQRITCEVLASLAAGRIHIRDGWRFLSELEVPGKARLHGVCMLINDKWEDGTITDHQAIELFGYCEKVQASGNWDDLKGGNRKAWDSNCEIRMTSTSLLLIPPYTPFDPSTFNLPAFGCVFELHKFVEYHLKNLGRSVSPAYYRYLLLLSLNSPMKWNWHHLQTFQMLLKKTITPTSCYGQKQIECYGKKTWVFEQLHCAKVDDIGADLTTFLCFAIHATSLMWHGWLLNSRGIPYTGLYKALPRIHETLETFVLAGGGVDPNTKVVVALEQPRTPAGDSSGGYCRLYIPCLDVDKPRSGRWLEGWVVFETAAAWLIPLFYHEPSREEGDDLDSDTFQDVEQWVEEERHLETSPGWDPRAVASSASGLETPPVKILAFGVGSRPDEYGEYRPHLYPAIVEDTSPLTSLVQQAFEEEKVRKDERIYLPGLMECLKELRPRATSLDLETYRRAVFSPASHRLVRDFFENPPKPSAGEPVR